MLQYNSNILKSDEGIIYVDNIKAVQEITKSFLKPNYLLVSSYSYSFYKDYNQYDGISYELYYIDNESNLQQLTYNVIEGNGLYIDDFNIKLNIDNKTIKENENHQIYIDDNELTCAYNNINKGVIKGQDQLFYENDLNNSGTINIQNGIAKISNGFLMSLYEIQDYYDKFNRLSSDFSNIAIKLDHDIDVFNIGDIIYIDKNGRYTKNEEDNTPFMICVIGSNMLSDGSARFMPLNFNNTKSIFARNNNNIYVKKLFSHVPVFEDNLNSISSKSKIIRNSYGFIATDNKEWKENFKNPFNYNENYYANIYSLRNNIVWYIDPDGFHQEDLYSINLNSIVTEAINFKSDENQSNIYSIIEIEFSDGFTGYYLLELKYSNENKRFEISKSIKTCKHSILLVKQLNNILSGNGNTNYNSKIKIYNGDTSSNLENISNQYQINKNNETQSSIKFNNDNSTNIDYKILESQNLKEEDNQPTEDCLFYKKTVNTDDLYETNNVNTEFKENRTFALSTTKLEGELIYTYKLIIDKDICDRNYAFLIVQLGDSFNNTSENIYLTYDSNEGLEYVFDKYQSIVKYGYIKIIAYASSEYLDKEPIQLGIIPVNEYQDSFKIVHLNKEYYSFEFSLENIIPIRSNIYLNKSLLDFNINATILSNNYYDKYVNSYGYLLDFNYYLRTEDNKYYIKPGGIKINLGNIRRSKCYFVNSIYYCYLMIRNGTGNSTIGKYRFINKNNWLELDENIQIFDLTNINQITIFNIQDINENTLNISLKKTGKLINRTIEWSNLRSINIK